MNPLNSANSMSQCDWLLSISFLLKNDMKNFMLHYIFSNKHFGLNEISMTKKPNDKVILFYISNFLTYFNKSQ